MAFELAHTSALAGIDAGSSGFTTVVRSSGMPGEIRRALEKLSAYQPDGASPMPVFGHRIVRVAARRIHVLTLIQPAGIDYTGRPNRLAWHLAFEQGELDGLHPLTALQWLKERANNWDQVPAIIDSQPIFGPATPASPQPEAWTAWGCDSQWADDLCNIARNGIASAAIVPESADLIALTGDIIGRAPLEKCWEPTVVAGSVGREPSTTLQLTIVHRNTDAARQLCAGVARRVIELPREVDASNEESRLDAKPEDNLQHTNTRQQPIEETHAYLFNPQKSEGSKPAHVPVELHDEPTELSTSSAAVSKPLIALIAIGSIALIGLLFLLLT